jgi:hypothetical protein
MHLDNRSPRIRWALLAVATVALAAMVATCRSVTDNVVSPQQQQPATDASNCISKCANAANDEIQDESDLHVDFVHGCRGDSLCLANEAERHQAAVAAIQLQRKRCQDGCHHQGGGGGGH